MENLVLNFIQMAQMIMMPKMSTDQRRPKTKQQIIDAYYNSVARMGDELPVATFIFITFFMQCLWIIGAGYFITFIFL